MPARLVAARDDPDRQPWLAELPSAVAELSERWGLTPGPPFQPGGEVSWVAPARDRSGRDLVLKVGWAHPDAVHEGAALRAWQGRGAVRLHAEHRTGHSIGLLLERIRPGTALSASRTEPEQDEVIATLLRELWREPPPGHSFRTLVAMCDEWAAEAAEDLAAGPDVLDRGCVAAGLALFRELSRDPAPQLLLATDLHAGNVLAGGRRPWLAVDPKPHVGDPCYDALQHLFNCERLDRDPAGLADRMAALLDLDRARLRRWLFARLVVETAWQPRLAPVAAAMARAC